MARGPGSTGIYKCITVSFLLLYRYIRMYIYSLIYAHIYVYISVCVYKCMYTQCTCLFMMLFYTKNYVLFVFSMVRPKTMNVLVLPSTILEDDILNGLALPW